MPVQINEVIIRTVVDTTPSSGTSDVTSPPGGNTGEDAEILERVLEIIKEKTQR